MNVNICQNNEWTGWHGEQYDFQTAVEDFDYWTVFRWHVVCKSHSISVNLSQLFLFSGFNCHESGSPCVVYVPGKRLLLSGGRKGDVCILKNIYLWLSIDVMEQ